MKNFLKKQREIMALLAYAGLVSGLVYFVVLPILSRINGVNDQIQQEIMKQESVKMHIEELPKIQKQYETLQQDGDLANALLDKNNAIVLIEKLEKLAESTNNKITIAVQEVAPVKKVATKSSAPVADTLVTDLPSSDYLQMKITLVGDYNSVVHFVDLLENFEYYSDITAIQIIKEDVSAKTNKNVANVGMFGVATPVETAPEILKTNSLSASFDAVFYTN